MFQLQADQISEDGIGATSRAHKDGIGATSSAHKGDKNNLSAA